MTEGLAHAHDPHILLSLAQWMDPVGDPEPLEDNSTLGERSWVSE